MSVKSGTYFCRSQLVQENNRVHQCLLVAKLVIVNILSGSLILSVLYTLGGA